MHYKAIMLDVDGTLVPYDFSALPSKGVAEAILKAQEKVHVCLVTGREYGFITNILKHLHIKKGFAVVNNGANVVDIECGELLYDQPILLEEAKGVISILREAKIRFYIKQHFGSREFLNKPFSEEDELSSPYMFYIAEEYPEKVVDAVLEQLKHFPYIALYKTHHKTPGKFGLNVTHVNSTKMHGIEIIMKHLQLKKDELIGVGDSYNDFALLMACGLKVAMGNAIDDLKEIADFVAPSVEEDGVAEVIQKFVLTD